ncbi:hypothetical protein MNBD_GAMMA09-927 [hydrothermal vent metagenome]|uniref:CheW-like domain-containing protein n=1 Tax=hydrothermal vent metagenome TaxID=652676 RepID=A0A3B0XIP8_9ZZZZ
MLDSNNNQPVSQNNQYYISILAFDDIEILLPQSDISSIESIYEFEKSAHKAKHLGHILNRNKKVPVYSFSSSLDLIKAYPGTRRPQCAILKHSYGEFAILCQDIRNTILSNIHFQNIPECMNNNKIPLTHLCLYQETNDRQKVGMVSNADALYNYIKNIEGTL